MWLLEHLKISDAGHTGFLQNDQHNTGSLASWCQARHGGGSLLARVVGGGHGLCIATALFAIPFRCLGRCKNPCRICMCPRTPVHFQSVCYQSFCKHSYLTDLYSLLADYLFVLPCKSLDAFGLEDFLGGNFKYIHSSWVGLLSWDVLPWLVDILPEGCVSTLWHWSIFLPDDGISLNLILSLSMLRIASIHACTCACFFTQLPYTTGFSSDFFGTKEGVLTAISCSFSVVAWTGAAVLGRFRSFLVHLKKA